MTDLSIATCQMEVPFSPTRGRLERADELVKTAARSGADLVVLPELFNTGYSYDTEIMAAAEPPDGTTARWLADRAQTYGVHLAGTFLLHEGADVYNTALLCAPDGQTWRYDKVHPWAWERSAFRGSRDRTVVAKTRLGAIGLLVCWDTAHVDLWAEYAGRVQFVLATSCVPDITGATYSLQDGQTFHATEMAGVGELDGASRVLFGEMVGEQARWLGVPVVNAGMCGRVETPVPRGGFATLPMLRRRPSMALSLVRGAAVRLACGTTDACRVIDADGQVAARLTAADGEAIAVGEVHLPARAAAPDAPQPATRLPRSAYVLSDEVLPRLMLPVYRRNLSRVFGHDPVGVLGRVRAALGRV